VQGIIYLAVNRVNGKAYVGQTTRGVAHRLESHRQKSCRAGASHFQRALNKYGEANFDVAVLETCEDKQSLNAAERAWIARLGSIAPYGYNIAAGGEGSLEARRSVAWNEAVRSPEARKKHSEHMTAIRARLTPEQREAWRINAGAARRGISPPSMFGDTNPSKRPEVREKIRASKLGKPRPEELKRRLSEIAKARYAKRIAA
jgi:group I intron endonuclease